MIIYKGYYHIKKSGGNITTQRFLGEGIHGSLGSGSVSGSIPCGRVSRSGRVFSIEVLRSNPLEKQVKSVLHELAHLGLEYEHLIDPPNKELWKYDWELPPQLLAKIERAVQDFYERTPPPPLLDYIKHLLIKSNS